MTLYETLQVPVDASAAEIKRSYFKLVRLHSPEKDPEGYKAIRSAYETLTDSKARQNYDSLQKHGAEIATLFSQAEDYMEKKEWVQAERNLKRLLLLAPEADAAHNMLGLCYLQNEQFDSAIKIYNKLTNRSPNTAAYWTNFAHACIKKADLEGVDIRQKQQLHDQAHGLFQEAIKLEPHNTLPYMGLAELYFDEDRYEDALRETERAISADGKADLRDLDSFMFLCLIHVRRERLNEVMRTAERIREITPNDPEARKYVAFRFGVLGESFFKNCSFTLAVLYLEISHSFAPGETVISSVLEEARACKSAIDEWVLLDKDPSVIKPLRGLAWIDAMDILEEEVNNREDVFKSILKALDDFPSRQIVLSLQRLEENYPSLYLIGRKRYEEIKRIAKNAACSQTPTAKPPLQVNATPKSDPPKKKSESCISTGCGCLMLILFIMFILAILGH